MMVAVLAISYYLLGLQIYIPDLKLLTDCYNYRMGMAQLISFVALLLAVACLYFDISCANSILSVFALIVLALGVAMTGEFAWSRVNSHTFWHTLLYRFLLCATMVALSLHFDGVVHSVPLIVLGVYTTNCPFGVVHGKNLILASYIMRKGVKPGDQNNSIEADVDLPDFSHAGNNVIIEEGLPFYDVTNFGILPNRLLDCTHALNELIDKVGRMGGGRIYFPRGRYRFNCDRRNTCFICINHNNIILEGETDDKGRCLTELICCNKTVSGTRNPWLSPFFITTGEALQPSNWFWGLQFRKKKDVVTRSGSMSDPGSDGNIITPPVTTAVIEDAAKGSCILKVSDSSLVGKYILLGLYNTNTDGSLIRDILGVDIKPEWKTPLRAGEEQAPSFQWLIEVDEILDSRTIRLVQPLWRDVLMFYEPVVCNVDMLENICIRNLKPKSVIRIFPCRMATRNPSVCPIA